MKKHIITLGGLPGSGKTTVRKLISDKLGYKTFSAGAFVREMAHARNISLDKLNSLIAKDKSLDENIDDKLEHINNNEDNYVVDAHLAFHFIPNGFNVYLDISQEKAAERIFNDADSILRKKSGDTMRSVEEACERVSSRIKNHIKRYESHYGLNPYIKEQYAFYINTENLPPVEIASKIIKAYNEWLDK